MTKLGTRETRQEEIKKMVELIVERFHPEKIILFGSHARGEAGSDSDIDLLVVMHVLSVVRGWIEKGRRCQVFIFGVSHAAPTVLNLNYGDITLNSSV